MNNYKLFLIIGPSGSGKSTIISELLKRHVELKFIPSFTTRKIRNDSDLIKNPTSSEKNGHSYFFINKKQFQLKIKNNEFLEWNIIYQNYYGLDKKSVLLALKKSSVIKDFEILGAMEIQKKLRKHCISIFINVQEHILLNRIKKRQNSIQYQEFKNRLNRQKLEVLYTPYFDFILNNNENPEETIQSILKIIKDSTNTHFKKKPRKFIHIIIKNPFFPKKILLTKSKKLRNSKFFIPNEYIFSKEKILDVIYRRLFLIFYPLSLEKEIIISKIKKIKKNILSCEFNTTNPIINKLEILETENFKLKWIDESKIQL